MSWARRLCTCIFPGALPILQPAGLHTGGSPLRALPRAEVFCSQWAEDRDPNKWGSSCAKPQAQRTFSLHIQPPVQLREIQCVGGVLFSRYQNWLLGRAEESGQNLERQNLENLNFFFLKTHRKTRVCHYRENQCQVAWGCSKKGGAVWPKGKPRHPDCPETGTTEDDLMRDACLQVCYL